MTHVRLDQRSDVRRGASAFRRRMFAAGAVTTVVTCTWAIAADVSTAATSSSLVRSVALTTPVWTPASFPQDPPARPDRPASDDPSTQPPATPPDDKAAGGGKSLDELLGIGGDEAGRDAGEDAAERERQQVLDESLREREAAGAFAEAVRGMRLSAELLGDKFDTGVGTQRIQEDVIAKLDILIKQPPKRSRSSSSSSSSSSQSQRQQQPMPRQQQQQQQSGSDARNNQPNDSGEVNPPPFEEGPVNSILDETRTEWGSLPERVRDMIRQGLREEPSSLYQRLTEAYYRRLAEDASR